MAKNKLSIVLNRIGMTLFYISICLILSGSYGVLYYSFQSEDNKIVNHDIELEFLESENIVDVTSAIPISDDQGKTQNETFAFQVRTNTSANKNIVYGLYLEKVDISSDYTVFLDNQVKIYLTDINDNPLIEPTKVSDLDNYLIFQDSHAHNSSITEVLSKYKIRVWIDGDVDGTSWQTDTLLAYRFRIRVKSI